MAATDAGGNPKRLSATPARVRAQWQMKEKTKRQEKEKDPPTISPSPRLGPSRASARLSLSLTKFLLSLR